MAAERRTEKALTLQSCSNNDGRITNLRSIFEPIRAQVNRFREHVSHVDADPKAGRRRLEATSCENSAVDTPTEEIMTGRLGLRYRAAARQ